MNPFLICTPYGFTYFMVFIFAHLASLHFTSAYLTSAHVTSSHLTFLYFSIFCPSSSPQLFSSPLSSPLNASPLLFSLCSFHPLFFFFFFVFFFLFFFFFFFFFFSASLFSFLFSVFFSLSCYCTFHYLLRPAAEARKITKCNSLARKEVRSKEKMGFVILAVPRSGPRAWYEDLVVAALQVAKTRDVMCYLAKGVTSIIPSFGGSCVAKIAAFTPLAFAPTSFCTTVTSFYTDKLSHQLACTMSELRSKVPAASGLPKWAGGTCWRMWNTLMKTNLKAGTT